jgi:hypothetical protein
MKKQLLLFVSGLLLTVSATAQNLVPNPSFEVQDTCPAVSQIYKAQPWVSASLGTPDLFNSTCSTQNSLARTGIGSAGVYTFNTFANNREYMEAPLLSSLVAGQTYCVSFYVKRANYRYACNRIGAYFSTSNINQTTTSVFSYTPQVDNAVSNVLTSSTNWVQISGSFVASGGENHIIIGSFASDANTDTVVATPTNSSKVCFYKIDDISVINCAVGLNDNLVDNEAINVFPNPSAGSFSIDLPASSTEIKSISIYNAIGQVVKRIDAPTSSNGTIAIPDLGLTNGLYTVSILTKDGVQNKQLQIQQQ